MLSPFVHSATQGVFHSCHTKNMAVFMTMFCVYVNVHSLSVFIQNSRIAVWM